MKNVTLTRLNDPDRKIVAIKNLRAATGLGLKDSKDIVDRLAAGSTAEDISVTYTMGLSDSFDFYVPAEQKLDSGLVLEFVLDVLSYSDPVKARAIMELPSYQRVRDALR